MSYREVLRRLSAQTDAEVRALWTRREAGSITARQFVVLAAAVVARANHRAVSVADLALAVQLSAALRRPVPPLGLTRPNDQPRLVEALQKVVDADISYVTSAQLAAESVAARAARLARNEPLTRAQTAFQDGMRDHGVKGWVRQTGSQPCELCKAWADGQVRPTDVLMASHTGCSCVQQPVVT